MFNNGEAVSKIYVTSQIAQITLRENRINLKTRNIKSDYSIEISNLNSIKICDSSNIGSINNLLPNLKRFKYILDEKFKGKILIAGHLNKIDSKIAIEGVAFDYFDNTFNKANYKPHVLPFRLENGNLIVSEDSFRK